MYKRLLIFSLILLVSACNFQKDPLKINTSGIDIDPVNIHRYGKDLFEIDRAQLKSELQRLQPDYLFFLKADLGDTLNLIQINNYLTDPKLINLYNEVLTTYPDLSGLEGEFTSAFTYYKHYFPRKLTPEVFTYISGIQYEMPVIYADSVMIVGLDVYLGPDYEEYKTFGIPQYFARRMQKEYIVRDAMQIIVETDYLYNARTRTLLDEMIVEGIKYYFIEAMIPNKPKHIIMAYTPEQLKWCEENESNIWKFIVEQDILYSADFKIIQKLIQDGPFTAGFGNHSPSRLGGWIGWQIVRRYMEKKPEVSLSELVEERDYQSILSKSAYKPRK